MKLKQLIPITALLISSSALSGASANNLTAAQQESIDSFVNHIESLAGTVPEYDRKKDDSTVEGEDNNKDGIRDAIHHLAVGVLFLQKEATQEDYDQLLNFLTYIQPEEPPVPNSISHSKVECDYHKLKDYIRKEASFDMLYWGIINTSMRMTAYSRSLVDNDLKNYERCPEYFPKPAHYEKKPLL